MVIALELRMGRSIGSGSILGCAIFSMSCSLKDTCVVSCQNDTTRHIWTVYVQGVSHGLGQNLSWHEKIYVNIIYIYFFMSAIQIILDIV